MNPRLREVLAGGFLGTNTEQAFKRRRHTSAVDDLNDRVEPAGDLHIPSRRENLNKPLLQSSVQLDYSNTLRRKAHGDRTEEIRQQNVDRLRLLDKYERKEDLKLFTAET